MVEEQIVMGISGLGQGTKEIPMPDKALPDDKKEVGLNKIAHVQVCLLA